MVSLSKIFRRREKCRFAYTCPYYQTGAVTCQSNDAQNGYCGAYRRFLAEGC